jgi:hypothetical protein
MDYEGIVRVILASPNDVGPERKLVARVIDRINATLADRNLQLKLYRWETRAYPGFHLKGRQCKIDDALEIEKADLFIAILWKRFGTPVHDARSGTEHEFKLAYNSYLKNNRPHIMFYFKEVSVSRLKKEELKQYRKVKKFRDEFPEEGLWWTFKSTREFEDQLFGHLALFIKDHYPVLAQQTSTVEIQPASSAVTNRTSKPREHKQVSRKPPRQPSSPTSLSNYFRLRSSSALAVTMLLFIAAGGVVWRLNSKLPREREHLAGIIEKDVDSDLPRIILTPFLSTRGEAHSDLIVLPSSPDRIHLELRRPETRVSGIYDVSLIDERSDATLLKLAGIEARDEAISFALNQGLLPEGQYRLILSRDTQVLEFYLFVIDR